jgi:hypothetical protein
MQERDFPAVVQGYSFLLILMKAIRWYGKEDMRVEEVPDPTIEEVEVSLPDFVR